MCRVNAVYFLQVCFFGQRVTRPSSKHHATFWRAREDRTIMSCNKQHFPACRDLIRINTRNNRSLFRRASNSWVHELFKQYWFIDQHCMQNARWGFGSARTGFCTNVPGAVPWIFQLVHVFSDARSIFSNTREAIVNLSKRVKRKPPLRWD